MESLMKEPLNYKFLCYKAKNPGMRVWPYPGPDFEGTHILKYKYRGE